jgi:hypothetical protein
MELVASWKPCSRHSPPPESCRRAEAHIAHNDMPSMEKCINKKIRANKGRIKTLGPIKHCLPVRHVPALSVLLQQQHVIPCIAQPHVLYCLGASCTAISTLVVLHYVLPHPSHTATYGHAPTHCPNYPCFQPCHTPQQQPNTSSTKSQAHSGISATL